MFRFFLSHPSFPLALALFIFISSHHPLISRLLYCGGNHAHSIRQNCLSDRGSDSWWRGILFCCSSSVIRQYPSNNHRRQHCMRHLTRDPPFCPHPPVAFSAKCSIYYVRACPFGVYENLSQSAGNELPCLFFSCPSRPHHGWLRSRS